MVARDYNLPMPSTLVPPPVETPPVAKAVEEHVQRLLQSSHFARADTQRKLLAYLWEHRHETVSEYAIATEALGRNHHFDSTSDASVRVHISRLRRKLKDYYIATGETELVVIPTGTHQLILLEPQLTAPGLNPFSKSALVRYWLRAHLVACLTVACTVLLVALCVLATLFVRQRNADRVAANRTERPNAFWQHFLSGDAPVKIVLPTPIFFNFRDHPTLKFRSTAVNEFGDLANDPKLKAFVDTLGPHGLEQSYTVTWDTLAAIEIARYLDRTGQGKRVSFEVTRDSSMMSLEQANVIVLGTNATLQRVREYTEAMNFTLARGEERVLNLEPAPGEPKEFVTQMQAKDRRIEPSIIAVLPGRGVGLKVLMLEARDTSGMASLLSSNAGGHAVEAMWKAHGSPAFFEMVVMTEREGYTPLRSWPVAMHAYTHGPPSKSM